MKASIDGLRHSQNIAVAVLGGGTALLAAVFGGFMIWQAGLVDDIGKDIKDAEQRVVTGINRLDEKLTDTRERVIKLEAQAQGISEQIAKFQRGALEPGFEVERNANALPKPNGRLNPTEPLDPTKREQPPGSEAIAVDQRFLGRYIGTTVVGGQGSRMAIDIGRSDSSGNVQLKMTTWQSFDAEGNLIGQISPDGQLRATGT